MKGTSYRLGEHKINETNGMFWWEAHAGVGGLKSGRCYVREDLLLIGPTESREPGYLKREFLERLQALPQWDHTRYYSTNYTIHDIGSGRKLTEKEISEWAGNQSQATDHTGPGDPPTKEEGESATETSYKLGRHEIIKKANGQVWWKSYSRSGSLREGRCIVAGEILFLGPGKTAERDNLKGSFLERLQQLPDWTATRLYCPRCAVHDCRAKENLVGEEGGLLSSEVFHIPKGEVFTPSATEAVSSTPVHMRQVTPLKNSPLYSLKDIVGKIGRGFEGKFHRATKSKHVQKKEVVKSRLEARQSPVHRFPIRRWIAWTSALILIVGSLVLILLNDLWKNWERHPRNHDHSDSHHRRH